MNLSTFLFAELNLETNFGKGKLNKILSPSTQLNYSYINIQTENFKISINSDFL